MYVNIKRAALAAAVSLSFASIAPVTAVAEMPSTLNGFDKTIGQSNSQVPSTGVFAFSGNVNNPADVGKKTSSAKEQTVASKKADIERRIAMAKSRAGFAQKQLDAYEKMMVSLSNEQKAFFTDRQEALRERLTEANADVRKLESELAMTSRKPRAASAATGAGRLGASSFDTIIARHAAANGVPLALARAVVRVESNFRANARGAAGEVGLMQIKPATARMMGFKGSVKQLYDPETNIKYGMRYLGKAHQLGGGSVCGTILKYNAGHGAKRMNPISANYCRKVQRYI